MPTAAKVEEARRGCRGLTTGLRSPNGRQSDLA